LPGGGSVAGVASSQEWRKRRWSPALAVTAASYARRRLRVTDDPTADPELLKRLEKAVSRLPHTTRAIFIARRLDDISYEEIAERTGLSVRQVERHMARAIYRLSREIEDGASRWWERLLGP
jgi:RNA polymerase sigma-70 factor (ECF subfamily)